MRLQDTGTLQVEGDVVAFSTVISSDEKNVIYHLTSSNFALMKELERNIRDNPAIISVELRR